MREIVPTVALVSAAQQLSDSVVSCYKDERHGGMCEAGGVVVEIHSCTKISLKHGDAGYVRCTACHMLQHSLLHTKFPRFVLLK